MYDFLIDSSFVMPIFPDIFLICSKPYPVQKTEIQQEHFEDISCLQGFTFSTSRQKMTAIFFNCQSRSLSILAVLFFVLDLNFTCLICYNFSFLNF